MKKVAFEKSPKGMRRGDEIVIQGKRNGIHRPFYEPEKPFYSITGAFIKTSDGRLYFLDEKDETKVKHYSGIESVRKIV